MLFHLSCSQDLKGIQNNTLIDDLNSVTIQKAKKKTTTPNKRASSIMAATVYILPCDADIGRIGGGAWECPALGLLSDTWENRNRKGKNCAVGNQQTQPDTICKTNENETHEALCLCQCKTFT